MAAAASQPVTMHAVAARAGVSQSAVSLVLNGAPARIGAATRERILRAAAELGYRPNLIARGLVHRRSYAIGLLVPDLRNPFFADVVSGAQRVAAHAGYIVLPLDSAETPLGRHLEALQARQIDGVIMDAVGASSVDPRLLHELDVVVIDEPSDRWPGLATDAEGAGRLAAQHLLELGHRRVAFIGPAADSHSFRMRERGFVKALARSSVSLVSELLVRATPTVAGGQAAGARLLALTDRPTAVFCVNDLVALGLLKACARAGVRVPEDLSIVGCDDIEMARLVTPELTTVQVPARELGARAARLLIDARDGRPIRPRGRPLAVKLSARGTTAPPGRP